MSVKAQALVWDFECPATVNGIEFKPGHKYVLLKYADHADHDGRNIYPSVKTVAKKTGYEERSVQRLTHELNQMGVLVEDGQGPRGTNRWYIPFSPGGDKISPLTKFQGDKNTESLGDIPSGDIPSGDILTPELKEPEPVNTEIEVIWNSVTDHLKGDLLRASYDKYIPGSRIIEFDHDCIVVSARDAEARDWMDDRLTATVQRFLVGVLAREVSVSFVVAP